MGSNFMKTLFSERNKINKTKMNMKKLLVSFVTIMSILFLVSTVSAVDFTNVVVKVDGIDWTNDLALIAGETVTVEVFFTSNVNSSDVKVRIELEGEDEDSDTTTSVFEVEDGFTYRKVLTLRIPHELEDEVSDDAILNLKIWGGDSETLRDEEDVRVQRPSYSVAFMSISTSQTVQAGKIFPVSVVLKNVGYNDLDDLYVTVRIPELNIERTGYFGDLVAIEDDDNKNHNDDNDVVVGKLFIEIPFEVKSGVYALEVEATSDNLNINRVIEIVVENGLSSNVIVSGNKILIVNPTNSLIVLRLIPESTGNVLIELSEDLVVIPAGSSRTVTITASGGEEYKINIFSNDGKLLESVTLSSVSEESNGNAVAILTVILTIIFLVLLVVFIVLVTKKPEKTGELGESYY